MNNEQKLTDSEILSNVINALDTNPHRFALNLGYASSGSIHHIFSGKNSISKSMADKAVKAYPRINYRYLTMGKGDPLLTPEQQVAQKNMFLPSERDDVSVVLQRQILSQLQEQTEILRSILKNTSEK